jgi:hypothetical protein
MLTEEQVKSLVKEAAEAAAAKAVRDTLLLMGITIADADATLQMQKDFQHLRDSREGKEEFVKKSRTALMGVFITGTLALITKGFWAEMTAFIAKVTGAH